MFFFPFLEVVKKPDFTYMGPSSTSPTDGRVNICASLFVHCIADSGRLVHHSSVLLPPPTLAGCCSVFVFTSGQNPDRKISDKVSYSTILACVRISGLLISYYWRIFWCARVAAINHHPLNISPPLTCVRGQPNSSSASVLVSCAVASLQLCPLWLPVEQVDDERPWFGGKSSLPRELPEWVFSNVTSVGIVISGIGALVSSADISVLIVLGVITNGVNGCIRNRCIYNKAFPQIY